MATIPEKLSAAAARRIALAAQGFATPRPAAAGSRHLAGALRRPAVVQIDSINVVARAHEFVPFARLGPYPRAALAGQLARGWFEYWAHEASYVPVALQPALRWRMHRAETHAWGRMRRIAAERPGYVESIYDEVAARGPVTASVLADGAVRAKSKDWWDWADAKTALEWLFWTGRITAAGRGPTFERRYDLTERVLPADVLSMPTPPEHEAHRTLLRAAARAHGVGTARDLADYFRIPVPVARPRLAELVEEGELVPARVEGWREPAYLDPSARRPRRIHARALMSPFDSLVWERNRTERIFGMRFRLEVYTPAAKRQHGYYVLPFLLGEELTARVDVKADRRARMLLVRAAHAEPGWAEAPRAVHLASELSAELQAMAAWLDLERVVVERRGDLAARLRKIP